MSVNSKFKKTKFQRDLLKFIDQYIDETGDKKPQMIHVSAWAIRKGLYEPPQVDAIRQFAKLLSRTARQEYIPGNARAYFLTHLDASAATLAF